jgi:hypothetical protein
MSATLSEIADPRTLISADLFTRLVRRVMEDTHFTYSLAERVVEQALIFLKACADHPGSRLSPTKSVDHGWYAFILHTEEYVRFCDRVAGRYIHHRPTGDDNSGPGATSAARTVRALRLTGYLIDDELWSVDSIADCNQCHAGCHDSP